MRSADKRVHLGKVYERLGGFRSQRTTTQLITGPTEPPFPSFLVILPRGQRGARRDPSSAVGGGKENLSIQRVKAQENKLESQENRNAGEQAQEPRVWEKLQQHRSRSGREEAQERWVPMTLGC